MLACMRTFALEGLETRPVFVEVDVRPGLPAFTVVGLGDASVRESRERVHAAILNSGFQFPARRITANLAPAHLPKIGPGFDLALACGVLAASGQVGDGLLDRFAVFGELSLAGTIRACSGTLAVAQATRRARLEGLILARGRAPEAALVDGLAVAGVDDLREAAQVLDGRPPRASTAPRAASTSPGPVGMGDLVDVRGQEAAAEAVMVAAAGGHHLLLSGPPGVGKTMLAWRLPGVLPPLTAAEAIEVTRIHSLVGRRAPGSLVGQRPFRAPHHSISAAGLVGGANPRRPGEAVLAHHGVLFLDELSEFSRATLEALRQPLEDGRVLIARSTHSTLAPARFMLAAATNPCPCGLGTDDERCRCTEADLARHHRRLSGPVLDRLDILVELERPSHDRLAVPGRLSSAQAQQAVLEARARQASRAGHAGAVNARMDAGVLRRHARLDGRGRRVLLEAHHGGLLSARGHFRVLRVARTIADLDRSGRVRSEHVVKALALRRAPGAVRGQVA